MNIEDRVEETTSTTGTGNITLAGAALGKKSFNSAFGLNKIFDYVIALDADWEVGRGYLSGTTTLVRLNVYKSSNSNALVSFPAGTKTVIGTLSAKRIRKLGSWSLFERVP